MYLSKITIRPSSQSAKKLLEIKSTGPYASHKLMWQLFSNQPKRDFLFREDISTSGLAEFFVLSAIEPVGDRNIFDIQSKPFTPLLSEGKRLAFKLRVNPTIYSKDAAGKSKRHDVLMHAKYNLKKSKSWDKESLKEAMHQAAVDWICDDRRLDKWGIKLDVLPEIERYDQHKSYKTSGQKLQFSSVDFQGLLSVVEPQTFTNQLQFGFGRAKSMGCGLMLIRPV